MRLLISAAFFAVLGMLSSAYAEGLGRLFFTPAERTQLNQHRALSLLTLTHTNSEGAPEDSGKQRSLTFDGIVQKDGGKRTVWINGVAKSVMPSDDNTSSMIVTLPDQNKTVRLKVGQRVLLSPPANTNTATSSAEKPAPANDD